jgi:GH15 family glucan-1,4-alpha-glucosidase
VGSLLQTEISDRSVLSLQLPKEGIKFRQNSGWKTLSLSKVLNDYKPISDYGVIGDQKTCALVGLDGSIDWFCIPRFDSPSVFGAILDIRRGGSFRILPEYKKDAFEALQYYEDQTNILVTEYKNEEGHLRITDFMPCFEVDNTIVSHGEIHRRVSVIEGNFHYKLVLDPRMDYGRDIPEIKRIGGLGYRFTSNDKEVRQDLALLTKAEFKSASRGGLEFRCQLSRDSLPQDFVLRIGGAELHHGENTFTDAKLEYTRNYWKNWISRAKVSGKWKDYVLRSALLLKLLEYSPTGAIIAAPTTSLPEAISGERNWDYRYSWIRDSSFVLWASHSIGLEDLVLSYNKWMTSLYFMLADNLQVMLGVSGERDLGEKILTSLSGYRGSSPVRTGNGAWQQLQLDVYGILLDAIYFSHRHGSGISRDVYNYVVKLVVKAVEENWMKPDCGIWEVRKQKLHFVYSKMWCWVAMDRAVRIANSFQEEDDANRFATLRDKIKDTILEKGYDKTKGSFVRSFGSRELDAANLLMPQVRFIDPNDQRMISTLNQTVKELSENGFLRRYNADDGLKGEEGAFLICSFWLVSCLTLCGKLEDAERLFDILLSYSNHLRLFSEEIDPKSGEMLGNFPQAFTHMGLITAAVQLTEAIEQRDKQDRD